MYIEVFKCIKMSDGHQVHNHFFARKLQIISKRKAVCKDENLLVDNQESGVFVCMYMTE
jgi:hypothetical protein